MLFCLATADTDTELVDLDGLHPSSFCNGVLQQLHIVTLEIDMKREVGTALPRSVCMSLPQCLSCLGLHQLPAKVAKPYARQ